MILNLIADFATLHLMGNPDDLYKYVDWKDNMLDYLLKEGGNNNDFDEIWNLEDNLSYKHELYLQTIHTILLKDDKYKVGDWFYVEHEYETRQYYGMGRISYNLKDNKKEILYYGEDCFLLHGIVDNTILPIWLQSELNKKDNFNKNILDNFNKYVIML
jgi:hypothetical protein